MKEDPDQGLVVRNLQRQYRIDSRELKSFLEAVASSVGAADRSATLALVGDARVRELNRDFRGHDKPTDVLAFSSGSPQPERRTRRRRVSKRETVGAGPRGIDRCAGYLGDIVISVETAHRQARRRGSQLRRELKVLTLHGFLHLLGYDHETDDGEMRRIEYRLRRKFRITTPRRRAA